jgi:hypothetical protein
VLQLFDQSTGEQIQVNNSWESDPEASGIPSHLAPTFSAKPGILTTLGPGRRLRR